MFVWLVVLACGGADPADSDTAPIETDTSADADTDADSDSDTDADADADSDSDADADADSDADSDTDTSTISYSRDVQPIFTQYCVDCHDTRTPKLRAADGPDGLFALSHDPCGPGNTKLAHVVPGSPEESFLMFRLGYSTTLTVDSGDCSRWMPAHYQNGPDTQLITINPAAVETLAQWIREGALDN